MCAMPYTILPGDVNTSVIVLSQGKVALIDTSDALELGKFNWCVFKAKKLFYAGRTRLKSEIYSGSRLVLMHRAIMNPPYDLYVDHIDGDGLNNRRSNLRLVTAAQNCHNNRDKECSTSIYKGVHWDNERKKWRVIIQEQKIGRYDSEEEAARVYDQEAKKRFGSFARLNFPL